MSDISIMVTFLFRTYHHYQLLYIW